MISHIRPIFALFLRAVRDDVRSKVSPIMRALAVSFAVFLIWINQRDLMAFAPGQQVLSIIAGVNLVAATLFGLGSFASAIAEEKEDDTMGLLLMTRLNPLAILLGKSTARLLGSLLFIAVQIPFTMICVALGGVSIEQILHVFAIIAAYLVFLCNLCLLWSVVCRHSAQAVAIAFAFCIVLYVVPFFRLGTYFQSSGMFGAAVEATLVDKAIFHLIETHPVFDTTYAIYKESMGGMVTNNFNGIPFHLIGAGVCFLASWALFRPCCSGGGAPVPRKARTPGRARRRHPRTWSLALAWKDFHFLTGGHRGMILRSIIYVALAAGLTLWLAKSEGTNNQALAGLIAKWCGIILFYAELGGVSSRIFGQERKHLTLGSIYALPQSTSSVIWQKVAGCLPAFLPSVAMWLLGSAIYADAAGFEPRRYEYDTNLRSIETARTLLWFSETALFPVLVAYLSLVMRRGALLTAIGSMLFANLILLFVLGNSGRRDEIAATIQIVSILCIGITLFLACWIPTRVANCAAEN